MNQPTDCNRFIATARVYRAIAWLLTLAFAPFFLGQGVVTSGLTGVVRDAGGKAAANPATERPLADLVSAASFVTLSSLSSVNDREEAHIVAVGQDNRYNAVLIDGSRINDQFGLNGTGLASFFNPLSIDIIDQLAI